MTDKCCNHDCNQGRTCPNRSKIIDAVNQTKQDMKGNNMKEEALKLADEILLCTTDPLHSKTSAMIRRLVEELDEKNYRILELTKRYKALTWNDKQSEPVVWWNGLNESEEDDFMYPKLRQAHIDHPQSCTHKFYPIPLYTTPQTKPLSDDEIGEIYWKLHSDDWTEEDIKFARAIEERHGIK